MAELQQILGSIFRDIAQARVTSDMYSRNISKYYEQDPLLRRFPLPRTDIDEVEVDLKFVMTGLEETSEQDEGRESSTATVYTKLARDISDSFFENILEASNKYANFSSETSKRLSGFEHRIYLSQSLLLYFQRNRGALIKEGKFDLREARNDIEQLLKTRFDEMLGDSGLDESQLAKLEKTVFSKLNVESLLKSIKKIVEKNHRGDVDLKAAIEVSVDKLAEAPEAAISSIKVKAQVRNYIWSKVEHEGETWRSLNPE